MLQTKLTEFLRKVSEDAQLRSEFLELARRHGFDLAAGELADADLEKVSAGAAYIKFDGIAGEAQDQDHKGWILVESASQTITR